MNKIKNFANVETPTPSPSWLALNVTQRVDLILKKLEMSPVKFLTKIQVVTAKSDGQIIVCLNENLGPSQRGPLLLDIEDYLKKTVDEALTVWLDPLGDRNSLRNLRGIEVKA